VASSGRNLLLVILVFETIHKLRLRMPPIIKAMPLRVPASKPIPIRVAASKPKALGMAQVVGNLSKSIGIGPCLIFCQSAALE
jgi:hypothetical protein